jgi:hypothetical protein
MACMGINGIVNKNGQNEKKKKGQSWSCRQKSHIKKHIKQRKRNIKSSSQFVGCTKELTNRYREVLIFFVFGRIVGVLEETATGGSGVQVVTLRTTEAGGASC